MLLPKLRPACPLCPCHAPAGCSRNSVPGSCSWSSDVQVGKSKKSRVDCAYGERAITGLSEPLESQMCISLCIRHVIADDLPTQLCEMGLLEARPEKKPRFTTSTAMWSHLGAKSAKNGHLSSTFDGKKARISLQSRLTGGGRWIRTLGTVLSQ